MRRQREKQGQTLKMETAMSKTPGQAGLNIYFAGAIRAGRDDAELYSNLIQWLKRHGRVLTEHVGDEDLLQEEQFLSEEEIFTRDMQWIAAADLVIAEVSTPSLGVGYELAVAEQQEIPVLCLYREKKGCSLSAMIKGNPFFQVRSYRDEDEAKAIIARLVQDFRPA